MSRLGSRQQKIHEVLSPKGATAYRARARELIEAAWRTSDISRKQHLFGLAKTYQRTADVMAPLPPDEPQVFGTIK